MHRLLPHVALRALRRRLLGAWQAWRRQGHLAHAVEHPAMAQHHARPILETLETRLLYSADSPLALLAADLVAPAGDGGAQVRLIGTLAPAAATVTATAPAAAPAAQAGPELVLVDARVPDLATLLDDLRAQQAAGRPLVIVTVGADEDGLATLSAALAATAQAQGPVSAVHLIGHGSAGQMALGRSMLDGAALQARAAEIAGWSGALSDSADLLLYGCDVGATDAGQALVAGLAALTGADVAASDNPTGSALLGGDWNLEVRSGSIEAATVLDATGQAQWQGLLAVTANAGGISSTVAVSTTSLSWSHTVAAGTNRALFVQLSIDGLGAGVTGVTYGGVAMTRVVRGAGNHAVEIWVLKNPTVGTANVVASFNASTTVAGGATTFDGVDQTNPFGTPATATGTSTVASVNVSSAVGDMVIDAQYWQGMPLGGTPGAGQSIQWWQQNAILTAGSTLESGAPTVTMSTSFGSFAQYELAAVSINAAPNAAPVVSTTGTTLAYTENAAATAVDPGLTVSDADNANLAGATVTISANYASGQDTLAFTNQNGITGSWNASNGTLTLSGSASVANYQAALRSITYVNSSDAPSTATRTVSFLVNDGQANSNTANRNIAVTAVNDAPGNLIALPGVADANLVGAYTFSNASALGRDDAGNNAPMTLYGSPGQVSAPDGSGALDLAGGASGQYGEITGLTTGGAMSFAGAVRFDTAGSWQRVFDFGQTDSTGIGNVYVGRLASSNDLTFTIEKNGVYTYRATATGAITDGAWLHFVATVDSGGMMKLYVNGALAATGAGVAPDIGVRSNNYIGKSHWAADAAFDGAIDNLVLVNRDLSAAEAQALYQQSTGFSVAENSANGTVIGTVVPVDVDASANPSYALTNNAGGRFAIDATTGTLTVANGAGLDFGAATSHSITVQVTDSGGASYSKTFVVGVTDVPEAPVLAHTALGITVMEDAGAPSGAVGVLVGTLTGGISDDDIGAVKGIAITATDSTHGSWYYSTDGGANWAAVGAVDASNALLLADDGSSRLYFAPAPNWDLSTATALTLRAWDQTSGTAGSKVSTAVNGGSTAFSSATDTVSLTVTPVNDAPTISNGATVTLTGTDENTTSSTSLVSTLLSGASWADVDTGAVKGVAITATTGNGSWQYSTDGLTWTGFGTVSATSALLLADTTQVRYVPDGLNGETATLSFKAWDRTSGAASSNGTPSTASTASNGGTTAFSTGMASASLSVSAVNDAPGFTGLDGTPTFSEGGSPVVLDANVQASDVELAAAGNYGGATLTLARHGGASAQDSFSATGNLGALLDGGQLVLSGTSVGRVVSNNGGTLLLRFDASATPARINEVLQSIAYANSSSAPPGSVRIDWTLSDGNTGAQGSGGALQAQGSTTVTITAANNAPRFVVGSGLATTPVTTVTGGGMDLADTLAVQPDGKTLVAGFSTNAGGIREFALVRYNADGTLDTGFGGGDGIVTLAIGGVDDEARHVLLQADGKILLGGVSSNGAINRVALVRLNADGSLDSSFGTGGISAVSLGGSADVYQLALQADGKLMVAGEMNSNFLLARFSASGSLDTGFGGGAGYVTTDLAGGSDLAYSLVVDFGGRIVLGGRAVSGGSIDFALVRYNADGTLDTSFNGSGKQIVNLGGADYGHSLALQADGKLVLGGWSDAGGSDDFALVRLNADGSLDTSFSGDGKLLTDLGTGSYDLGSSVVMQADGKIVVGGQSRAGGVTDAFALVRYNADGSLDTGFGGTGIVVINVSAGADRGVAVALGGEGRILIAGDTMPGSNYDFGLASVNADGTVDTRFNPANTLDGAPAYTEGGAAVVLDANVQVLDAELAAAGNYGGATLTLARHGGASAQDQFSAQAAGTLAALTQGNALVVGGTTIGTVTSNSGGTLVLSFNGNASNALVNAALQQIAYANSSDAPPASAQIDWTFSDGNGGTQGSGGALAATGSTTVAITAVNDAPVISSTASAATFVEGGLPQVIDATGVITDPDSTDFNGGTLLVYISANASVDDRLTVGNGGTGPGQVGVSGGSVSYEGTVIGTVGGGTAGNPLVVSFNASATAAAVQQVYRSIQFDNPSDAPATATREVTVELSDGDGGAATPQTLWVQVQAVNDPPVLGFISGHADVPEGYGMVILAPSAAVSDIDSANFNGGRLEVYFTANGSADDRLGIRHQGSSAGLIGVSGADVTYGGVVIGTWSGGTDGSTPLVVQFNANADATAAQALARNITFRNDSENPSGATRALAAFITDGDGGTSNVVTGTLRVVPVNDAPTTTPVTLAAIAEDSGARVITQAELLGNATDVEGSLLTASALVITAGGGSLVDNGGGSWTYTPVLNDDTAVGFSYTITDNGTTGGVADPKWVTGSATLDITAVNDAPTTTPVTLAAIAEDSGARVITQAELLGNAADVEGNALVASALAITAGGGSLVDNLDGTWTYRAALNDDTSVSFSYSINDNGTTNGVADPKSVAGSATLDITAVNNAPTTTPVTLAAIAEDSGARLITQAELLGNAADVEGNALTVSALVIASGRGTLADNGDGSWTYTPVLNDDSSVSFSYTITDNGTTGGVADPKTVAGSATLDITAVNDAPTTTPVTLAAIAEDSGARVITQAELLGNAHDVEGNSLTASALAITVGGGGLVDNGDGTWTYTPALNDDTAVNFSFTITDNGTTNGSVDPKSVVGSATLDITAVNDAPTTTPVTLVAIAEDSGARVITQAELLGNAHDVEGNALVASALAITAGSGSLVDNLDGTWTYRSALNDDTSVSFSYTIADHGTTNGVADPKSVSASATLDITPVNDAPTTSAVTLAAIAEDSGARLITQAELLGNAADVEGNALTASALVITAGGGSLVDNGNGSWTYRPALNDDTSVSFSYTITDNGTTNGSADPKSAAGSATLDITAVNDAPTTPPVTLVAIAEDSGARVITQAGLLGNAHDVEGNSLTASALAITAGGGSLVDNGDGTWTYRPALNDDTSVSFSYTITDNGTTNGAADPKTVAGSATLDITPVNDAPTTTPMTLAAIAEDSGTRVITQAELLGNAHDVEGNTLTASALAITAGGGSLVDNGDGTWTYRPALNDDTSVSFSYTITDNGTTNGSADPKTVAGSATLDITAVNDAPITTPVTLAAIAEDSGARVITQAELLGNAHDVEGDALVASALTITAGSGSLVDNGNGTWTYTPVLNDDTAVNFSFTITDNGTTNGVADPKSVAGSATLDITAVNDAPTTSAVTLAAIAEDRGAQLITQAELLGNAHDAESDTLTASGLTISAGGGSLVNNGNGTWTYTPALNDDTSVSFSYTITDNGMTNGSADPKTVAGSSTLDITPVNDAPTTTPLTLVAIAEDSGARVITQAELLGNAHDVEGDTLTASGLTISVGSGSLVDNGDGSWTYTPAPNDDSSVSFNYTITDNGTTGGVADPKTVAGSATLDITAANDAPTTSAVTLTAIAEDSGTRVITQAELLGNAHDVEGDALVASALAITAGNGSLVDNGDGSWTYRPALNDDTSVSFSYTITDNGTTGGVTDPKSVAGSATLDITALNDAPTTSAVTLTAIAEDSGGRLITQAELLGNAHDVEGNVLVASALTITAGGGSLVNNGDGSWTYTPALNDDSSVSFSYTITDNGTTGSAADPKSVYGSATLDITPVNDTPTLAANQGLQVAEGDAAAVTGALLRAADVDDSAAALRFTVLAPPDHGRLERDDAPGVAVRQFTQADIDTGHLRYVHDGSETLADGFVFSVSDAAGASLGSVRFGITITPVDDAPTVASAAATTLPLQADGVATTIGLAIGVADVDSPQLAAATLQLGGAYQIGHDRLVLSGSHPMNATWQAESGTLTLQGSASVANYAAALGAVKFVSDSSVAGSRTLTVTVSDGQTQALPVFRTLRVAATLQVIVPSAPAVPVAPAAPVVVVMPGMDLATSAATADTAPVDTTAAPDKVAQAAARDAGADAASPAGLSDSGSARRATPPLSAGGQWLGGAGSSTAGSRQGMQVVVEMDLRALQAGPAAEPVALAAASWATLASPDLADLEALVAPLDERVERRTELTAAAVASTRASAARGLIDEAHGAPLPTEDEFEFDAVANPGVTAGLIMSASLLWWATRAGGLVAAMMASVPAWRAFDPLPILARGESADDDTDTGDGDDTPAGAPLPAAAGLLPAGATPDHRPVLAPAPRPMLEEMADTP